MAKEVKLPMLGQTMEQGTIINCLVEVGRQVKKDDILFEIETDKVTFELQSPDEGFVKAILVQPQQTVSVGEVLLILGQENEKISHAKCSKIPAEKPAQKKPIEFDKLNRAEKMLFSKREKPCFYLNINVDATELDALCDKMKVSINAFLIKALSLGLVQWPVMTSKLEDDSIRPADSIDINFAIMSKKELINVVIKQADKKNLNQISKEIAELIEKADTEKLTNEDLEIGCITLSNLGQLGIDSFIPIVEPGQCGIIGVGKISENLVLEKEKPVMRKFMKMTIAVDHKIANGAEAAQFLSCAGKLLEDPEKLTLTN